MSTGQGWTIWLTGLPAAGKSTLARALGQRLAAEGISTILLDSDELRPILTPTADYAPAGRDRFYAALAALAALLASQGARLIIAATAPRRAHREAARQQIADFAEVWVRCPVALCRARDPKGLYRRAARGQLPNLPGVGAPYEPPRRPDLIVDSSHEAPEAAVAQMMRAIPFLRPARVGESALPAPA